MRFLLNSLFLLFFLGSLFGTSLKKTPAWVKRVQFTDVSKTDEDGGYYYLLVDIQDNLKEKEQYRHYAAKVFNAEGISALSDIQINYDPTYQSLEIHKVNVVRGGQVIDRFDDSRFRTIQRETSSDRSLYDGSLTAVLNLSDIKKGDVIEYSYTIKGFNPINKGHYYRVFYHQYNIPIGRIFNRVLTPSNIFLDYQLFGGAAEPMKAQTGGILEYTWDRAAEDNLVYDNNVPGWYDPSKRVVLSTFKSWEEVVDWAVPLYQVEEEKIKKIKEKLKYEGNTEQHLLRMIRFVQDDIRYLGFESGMNAYKPHAPLQVFEQGYGDCKDKSLLLVSLLRSEGIDAYPLLVNTYLKQKVRDQLPSNQSFDHCVVNFNFQGKEYFVDPTISSQGGDLAHLYFPPYKVGLLVKPSENKLIDIEESKPAEVFVKEFIDVIEVGGEAQYTIRTEYSGTKADYIRSYFNNNTLESVEKEYLNYYSAVYPGIKVLNGVKTFDYERQVENTFIVEESYSVPSFWQSSPDDSYIYGEIYPLVLESMINYTNSAERSMPYYIGEPAELKIETQVSFPENWSVTNSQEHIEGDGFEYSNTISGSGNRVFVYHYYKTTKEYIEADQVKDFLVKHDQIQDQLSFYVTHNDSYTGFKLSWVAIILSLISLGVGVYFGIKVFREYDPESWIYAEDKAIGGWLVLPAIGVTISPVIVAFQIFNSGYFNQNTWLVALNEYKSGLGINFLLGLELIYNSLFIVFGVLAAILFFNRRTSVPRIMTILYALGLVFPIVDWFITEQIAPDLLDQDDRMDSIKEIARGFIGAAIWIPYFNISERVKSTFCRKYGQKHFISESSTTS